MPAFETLARFGNFRAGRIEVEPGDTTSAVYRASQGQERLKQICLGFYRQVQQVRSNTALSAEGHSAEIKKAAKAALRQLDEAARTFLDPVTERLKTLRTEFRFDVPPTESVSATLREIEMRAYLEKLDREKRYLVLEEAIGRKDEVVFRAFSSAPEFLGLLPPKIIDQARQLWAEQKDLRTAKELKDLTVVSAILVESFGEAYQGIGALGQVIDDSMRARLQRLAETGLATAAASYQQHRLARETTDTAGNPMAPSGAVLNTGS